MCNTDVLGRCVVSGKVIYNTSITLTGNKINYYDWKNENTNWHNTK